MNATTLLDCGHEPSEHSPITNGFGRDAEGRTYCYDCCTVQDLETIRNAKPGDRSSGLYLSCDGVSITNWPGRRLMGRVRSGSNHPWSRERYYVTAVDELGRTWSGIAGKGEYAVLRLTKQGPTLGEQRSCARCSSDVEYHPGVGWVDRGSATHCDESGQRPYDAETCSWGEYPHRVHCRIAI